jgi:protein phosphatase
MNIVRRLLSTSGGHDSPSGGGGPVEDVIDFACATDVGGRSENQDRCRASTRWGLVSDGVGGHSGGALAAEITVGAAGRTLEAAGNAFDERITGEAIRLANDAVQARRQADVKVADMAATLTVATARSVSAEQSRWVLANVGDSPAWLVTAAEALHVTVEHTLTAELLRAGAIPPEAAATHPQRHVVTRAIGMESQVLADSRSITLAAGDSLILASDGLSDVMGAADIFQVVAGASTADEMARKLVEAALQRDTADNVTVVVLRHRPVTGVHDRR